VDADRVDARGGNAEGDVDAFLRDLLLVRERRVGGARRGAEIVHPADREPSRRPGLPVVDLDPDLHPVTPA
jgi:hypothetical protein